MHVNGGDEVLSVFPVCPARPFATIRRLLSAEIPGRSMDASMNKPSTDPREVLKDVRERNRQFYSDLRGIGALKDLQHTFPNPWLYVAELLQNAIDERATRIVALPQDDGSLIFEHNGSPFSETNVESLCMRGVSSKGAWHSWLHGDRLQVGFSEFRTF